MLLWLMISVVIPAFNEEKYLPATLAALAAELASDTDHEILVVDNESTDSTRQIATAFGAKIVDEPVHTISAVRNAGGLAAPGGLIVFLDADTLVPCGLFQKIRQVMSDPRCIGGTVNVKLGPMVKRKWISYYISLCFWAGRFARMRLGAMQFCTKKAFLETGGYDRTIYVGEDVEFQWRLRRLAKKWGGHTAFIEAPQVVTSARRFEKMALFRLIIVGHPFTVLLAWRKASFWKDWYENAIR